MAQQGHTRCVLVQLRPQMARSSAELLPAWDRAQITWPVSHLRPEKKLNLWVWVYEQWHESMCIHSDLYKWMWQLTDMLIYFCEQYDEKWNYLTLQGLKQSLVMGWPCIQLVLLFVSLCNRPCLITSSSAVCLHSVLLHSAVLPRLTDES